MADADLALSSKLDRANDGLDPIMALMALIQLTGDRTLLHRYWSALDGRQETVVEAFRDIDARQEHAPVDPVIAAEIRGALRTAITAGRPAIMPHPDMPMFRKMSRLLFGRDLPDMSVDVAFQHAGFKTDTRVRMPRDVPPDFKVIVVGAGMIGINAAVKLQQAGFDFTVLEALDKVGGNWLTNTYPGAAVDTPSRVYSFSFEPDASWTRYYPRGLEFLS